MHRDLCISIATLSLCLSSKEKHHQGYQWQISFLVWRNKECWRENDKFEKFSYLIYAFFFFLSRINWFLATVSTIQLHALSYMQLLSLCPSIPCSQRQKNRGMQLISLFLTCLLITHK